MSIYICMVYSVCVYYRYDGVYIMRYMLVYA